MKKGLVIMLVFALIGTIGSEVLAAAKKKALPKSTGTKTIAPAPASVAKPAAAPVPAGQRGFAAKGGLIGGAGVIELGYYLPVGLFSGGLNAGYGIGNKYNVMTAQLEAVFKLSAFNAGLSVDYADYTSAVRNLPGMPGDTAKGAHTGVGLTISKEFGKLNAGVGYSTALGLVAAAGYKF